MASFDHSTVEADLFDALMSVPSFDALRYDTLSGNSSVTLANKGDLTGKLADYLGAKEGRVILKYDKAFRGILSITIRYEEKGDMAEKLKKLLTLAEGGIKGYDLIHPYDEDEMIEDGLNFTLLDLSVNGEEEVYDKASAIVEAASKIIEAIG